MSLPAAPRGAAVAFVAVAVAVIAGVGLMTVAVPYSNNASGDGGASLPSTETSSTNCVISGQPGGFAIRVISDASGATLSGAVVAAKNTPFSCGSGLATSVTSVSFTTNGTEWVSLPSDNNYRYSVTVTYAGQSHTFTATLRPVSLTCATISLPSGKTDVTITEFGENCASIQG